MKFVSPLTPGRLVRRYKRFLADVALYDGGAVTATCPNTGSMIGLAEPGAKVWLSRSDSVTRKYPLTWEMVEAGPGKPSLVGINTGLPNTIVREAIEAGKVPELAGYPVLRREVRYGEASRIDILLEGAPGTSNCYVEIKNVHMMRRPHLAEFPDSRTERGVKHLEELSRMVAAGHRAVMLFLAQRADARSFSLAADIDPRYAAAFQRAADAGVEMLCYRCRLSTREITLDRRIDINAVP